MTLYRETPCEHEYVDEHGPFKGVDLIGCPGGSREEVTIDYEAAAEIGEQWLGQIGEDRTLKARAMVDAALHTEREPASTA